MLQLAERKLASREQVPTAQRITCRHGCTAAINLNLKLQAIQNPKQILAAAEHGPLLSATWGANRSVPFVGTRMSPLRPNNLGFCLAAIHFVQTV